MRNDKLLFTSVKGFGDLVILSNFIVQSKIINYSILITRRNYELALEILPDISKVYVLDKFDTIPSFFDLKKNLFKCLPDLLYYRNKLRGYIKKDYKIVVDIDNLKNNFVYFGLNPLYINKRANIYSDYSIFFNSDSNKIFYKNIISCVIFPLGSTQDRNMNEYLILELVDILKLFSIKPIILVHNSHKVNNLLFGSEITYFNKISELINIIKNTSFVITVDSVALHLATFYGIYSYVCSNKSSKFIPTYIIDNKVFFNNNYPNNITEKLLSDLTVNQRTSK
jgi:ADP-heptose:LPS heptosyltransferase